MFNSLTVIELAALALSPGIQADTSDYWQQEVRYSIAARLDEDAGVVSGSETITYFNRSPNTLDRFYVHLYLNAFRPGSRWADRDSVEGNRRFNDLADPDYAFERIDAARIQGVSVVPEYPYAPDSTIAAFRLPQPLPPGGNIVVEIEWQARPSTLPRRQGRQGRRYDFAQWYPRVAVYDRGGWQAHPLYPAGEFYGEFGSYDVVFDLPEDQVIGSTGVPVEGDPGWESARAASNIRVDYQRDAYGPLTALGDAPRCEGGIGRKCVRFVAKDVHHFAWSVNPEYIYEQGRFNDIVVRALYLPGEEGSWGSGIVVNRTVEALRWLDDLFGPYPWPQITNLHRIEGGGTEFPMVVMDGGPSLGLILHEVGHQYLMGILANNEWKQGFLDEGFSSFQGTWYTETVNPGFDGYPGLESVILGLDLDGWSEPLNTPGEDFRDFATYGAMTYSKAQWFYMQLRYVVGHDVMRRILREYYARWKLKHVTPEALQSVAEEVSGMELGWFFDQWLNDTPLVDYALKDVDRTQLPDGTWETTVEVERKGDGLMPVEIGTRDGSEIYGRITGLEAVETLTFRTDTRPARLMLDPRVRSHDWNFLNNREIGFFDFGVSRIRFDDFLSEPGERDRLVESIAPTVWWNHASDLTVGIRYRSNYLNRYNKIETWTGRGVLGPVDVTVSGFDVVDHYIRLENPYRLRTPGGHQSIEYWWVDGTVGAKVEWGRERRSSFTSSDRRYGEWSLAWVATRNMEFLDPERWDNAGTVELNRNETMRFRWLGGNWNFDGDLTGGLVYRRIVGVNENPEPFARATVAGSVRMPVAGFDVGLRLFGGGYLAENLPVAQRAIQLGGANPYELLRNPLVRTHNAPLTDERILYHSPGEANMRGFRDDFGGRWIISANFEIEKKFIRRNSGVLRSLGLVAFADGALVDTVTVPTFINDQGFKPMSDAGGGVRAVVRLGDITFPIRVEFPLFVSDPSYDRSVVPGTDWVAFRWLVSFQPTF